MDKESLILDKLRAFDSPHCLKVLKTNKPHFQIIEKCSNGSLYNQISLSSSGFSETSTRMIMSQLFKTYNILHSLGMTHNDIKPENAVVDADYNIKLIDFGCSEEINSASTNF